MTLIAANQTVSAGVYSRTVADQARLPHDFLATKADRIQKAYEMGEPIDMIVDELRMVYELRATYRPTKTPRQLALRVVKA